MMCDTVDDEVHGNRRMHPQSVLYHLQCKVKRVGTVKGAPTQKLQNCGVVAILISFKYMLQNLEGPTDSANF